MNHRMTRIAAIVILLGSLTASAGERILQAEVIVPAPVADVWKAWTTEEGLETFFAPETHVDLRVDGLYEILFFPDGEPGRRGAEGMRILAIEPMRRFSFTWNQPPQIPAVREQRTQVTLELEPVHGGKSTRLRFTQSGWGRGEDWDRAYDYFDHAWGAVVLPRMLHRFENGPVDWKRVPRELTPVAESIAVQLVAPSKTRG